MAHPLSLCLWFEDQAKEAAEYYCSIFKDSKITQSNPMVTMFTLNGSTMMALNGNKQAPFNESASVMVNCDTQEEIDYYWDSLTANGGSESVCGWLKDKYGVSWQILPAKMGQLLADPEKSGRVMEKVMKMEKADPRGHGKCLMHVNITDIQKAGSVSAGFLYAHQFSVQYKAYFLAAAGLYPLKA